MLGLLRTISCKLLSVMRFLREPWQETPCWTGYANTSQSPHLSRYICQLDVAFGCGASFFSIILVDTKHVGLQSLFSYVHLYMKHYIITHIIYFSPMFTCRFCFARLILLFLCIALGSQIGLALGQPHREPGHPIHPLKEESMVPLDLNFDPSPCHVLI